MHSWQYRELQLCFFNVYPRVGCVKTIEAVLRTGGFLFTTNITTNLLQILECHLFSMGKDCIGQIRML